jgi:acetyl esterase
MPVRLADEQLTAFIRMLDEQPQLSAARTGAEALRRGTLEQMAARRAGPEMYHVQDLRIASDGPLVRVYRPTGDEPGVVVFSHGGGWVIGDLETHDRVCRRLAARSGLAVAAVDYRRAPEHPWPAAVDDAVTVLSWVRTRPADLGTAAGRVAVAGDSAGGTTAMLACLRLRDGRPQDQPDGVVLAYANTDLTGSGASMETEGHGYGLERDDIAWFNAQWVPDAARLGDPAVSPLFAPDLSRLPPTVIVTCEHDPLRDQGEALAQRLQAAGTPTELRREVGMVHNFLLWDLQSPACAAAGDRIADDLARLLAPERAASRQ